MSEILHPLFPLGSAYLPQAVPPPKSPNAQELLLRQKELLIRKLQNIERALTLLEKEDVLEGVEMFREIMGMLM